MSIVSLDACQRERQTALMAESKPNSIDPREDAITGRGTLLPYAASLAMVALATIAGTLLAPRWGNSAVDLLYLPAVLAAAIFLGLWPALLAGVVSTLAYNFFFTSPFHTLHMDQPADIVTVVILLLVAAVTSRLAANVREQAEIARALARRNATIAGFAARLLSCSGKQEAASVACIELSQIFGCNVVMVEGLPQPTVLASHPGKVRLTAGDIATVAIVLESGGSAGRGEKHPYPTGWQFHPVRWEAKAHDVIGLARDDDLIAVRDDQQELLASLLDQIALALGRAELEAQVRGVAELRERDRLRAALLSSVGHDLRTPLTAIIAAAAELRMAGSADAEIVRTLTAESGRLERYISDLLDMARIESGAVKLKTEPVDLVDSVGAAVRDLQHGRIGNDLDISLESDLPLVTADPQLLHHCLMNLIDNAICHGGNGRIRIAGTLSRGEVTLSVEDRGPGLPCGGLNVFDNFRRISGSDQTGGTGLGLAIVKAFVEAMGADVTAKNRRGGGASFSIHFPGNLVISAEAAGA